MRTANPLSQSMRDFGVTFTPAIVAPGQEYWSLIRADGPLQAGGNHHLYVDVLGYAGQRMVGVNVEFYWNDGRDVRPTEAKPGEPAALSFPLYAGGNAYGVRVAEARPSDSLYGVGLGNFVPHHSFVAIFQLARAQDAPTPAESPLREAIRMARHWIDEAERRLGPGL